MADNSLKCESINDLIQQVEEQCTNLDGLVSCINKRLEGEVQAYKALTSNPSYPEKQTLFQQAGRYHPLLETLYRQHQIMAEQGLNHTKHSYLEHSSKRLKP